MSFREFISNFRFRRRLEAEAERRQNHAPPANPSPQYVNGVVQRLLSESTAYEARKELGLLGAAAVAALESALDDPQFSRAKWDTLHWAPTPLEAVLELLVEHAPDKVASVALPLAKSESVEKRRIAGRVLARLGRAALLPTLRELLRDEDVSVRSHVVMGVSGVAGKGRGEDAFRREVYDLLLSICDQQWSPAKNKSADAMILLDRSRAAIDLTEPQRLRSSSHSSLAILRACNGANIAIPADVARRLLETALPLVVGPRPYPHNRVAAEALHALAQQAADGAAAIAESLLSHDDDHLREQAAEALAVAAGLGDPVHFVLEREKRDGFEALSRPQQVVFCAFCFDAEVCNGGLMQFFGNINRPLDTLSALSELGHQEAYAALEGAMKLAGPLSRELDRELRLTAFESRWDELAPAFRQLEQPYFAAAENLRKAWCLYAIRHADQFRPPA